MERPEGEEHGRPEDEFLARVQEHGTLVAMSKNQLNETINDLLQSTQAKHKKKVPTLVNRALTSGEWASDSEWVIALRRSGLPFDKINAVWDAKNKLREEDKKG